MPGFVTHYLFGEEIYHQLKCNFQKKNLFYNRSAYAFGLQGPDLFFYYLPSYALHRHNLGALAHTTEPRAFFRRLLESYGRLSSAADRGIAEAYISGFLGHYLLDTTCHPYIYAMTHYHDKKEKSYFSRHAYLETEIDTELLARKRHKTPCEFHAADTIQLTFAQKRVIAGLLYDAYHYAFPELSIHRSTMWMGIISLPLGMRILHDETGQKKVLFRFMEKHFLGYPLFSPLIPSDTLFFRTDPFNLRHASWKNPWDATRVSTESFFDLYEKSSARCLTMMRKLHTLLHTEPKSELQKQLTLEFLKEYGNLSFHSGLDAQIPS